MATVATLALMEIGLREAKNQLSQYGNLAHAGKVVTVCKNGHPWFDLVPHRKKQARKVSPLRGVQPVVSEKQAVESVDVADLQGWI